MEKQKSNDKLMTQIILNSHDKFRETHAEPELYNEDYIDKSKNVHTPTDINVNQNENPIEERGRALSRSRFYPSE